MRRGSGPWRGFLSSLGTLLLVCICMVVLVTSGGWGALSRVTGIGNPDASLKTTTGTQTGRNPDAKTPEQWWKTLTGGTPSKSGGSAKPATGETAGKTTPNTGGKTPTTAAHEDITLALSRLNEIGVAKPHVAGYDRESKFGGWANAPGMCGSATTRDLILKRDLTDVAQDRQCRVTSGRLADPYTGASMDFKRGAATSQLVQIDHVVALQDAWASGAYAWSQAKRVAYANSPGVLLAVNGKENMAKGAGVDFNGTSRWRSQHTSTPDIWMPSDKAYRCDYMARRVAIKHEYKLSMSAREKQQTVTFLGSCRAGH